MIIVSSLSEINNFSCAYIPPTTTNKHGTTVAHPPLTAAAIAQQWFAKDKMILQST